MSLPTFNGFSLQDTNFIAERIVFKGYAQRAVIRAQVNRREGIKVLGTEFGEKEVTIEGNILASSASALQTLLDSMKQNLQGVEGSLIIETNRTWTATVVNLAIPDEHYNQSKAPFMVTFVCSKPFSEGPLLTAVSNVPSGLFTYSGSISISGTVFNRPILVYTPPAGTGITNIKNLTVTHTPTGQAITVSGFGSGTSLGYQNAVQINFDDFTSLEGSSAIGNTGAFPKWEPGVNNFTVTVSGRFVGGTLTVIYQPRYL